MAKFTNNTAGPKGVHTLLGLIYIAAGATSDDLEVSEGELKSAKSTGWFTVEGDKGGEGEGGLNDLTVPELKQIAEDEKIDLGDAKLKADIVAAIELAREAKAKA